MNKVAAIVATMTDTEPTSILLSGRLHKPCPADSLCGDCQAWMAEVDRDLRPILREAAAMMFVYLEKRVVTFNPPSGQSFDEFVNSLLNDCWEWDVVGSLPLDGDPVRRRAAIIRRENAA